VSYAANDLDSGGLRVVRILRQRFVDQPTVRARFLDAARRSSQIVHHGLVLTRWTMSDHERKTHFAVRDFVRGVTLREVMDEDKALDPQQILRIIEQIVLTLKQSDLYETVLCHGGVRPANVFLGRADHGERVVLGDIPAFLPAQTLGLADRLQDFFYAAPEGLFGDTEEARMDGVRYDLYGLGCLGYELFCGRPPIVAKNVRLLLASHGQSEVEPPSRLTKTPVPGLDEFFLPFLAADPTKRLGSLDDAIEAIETMRRNLARAPVSAPMVREPVVTPSLYVRRVHHETNVTLAAIQTAAESLVPVSSQRRATEGSLVGQVIDGRYRMQRLLGSGGMGTVYLAEDLDLERRVAIKVLSNPLREQWDTLFRREARTMARFDHANILQVFDVRAHEGLAFLVMPYLSGGSLQDRAQATPQRYEDVVAWLRPIARALDASHSAGLIHSDVKPSNILFDEGGNPVLADFGISRLLEPEGAQTSSIIGTPAYMSPEAWTGVPLNPASDQFSLGVTVYYALEGRLPFNPGALHETRLQVLAGTIPPMTNTGVPKAARAAVVRALSLRPEARFASCSDFAAAFAGPRDTWWKTWFMPD
jgi:serine/threonine protein kinase